MIILSNILKLYDGTSATGLRPFTNEWMSGSMRAIIKAVQPHKPSTSSGDLRCSDVDCETYTVTPGLIDCHGHVTLWGVGNENLDRMNSPEAPFLGRAHSLSNTRSMVGSPPSEMSGAQLKF